MLCALTTLTNIIAVSFTQCVRERLGFQVRFRQEVCSEQVCHDAWSQYYESGNITWTDPATMSIHDIEVLAQGPCISRIMELAGMPDPRHAKVLEAGCGLGLHSFALASLGYTVDAFDLSAKAVEIARQIQGRLGSVGERVTLKTGNLLKIDHPDEAFDLVFNQAVMEYFIDDGALDKAIAEMVRVLKPGGKLVVVAQNTGSCLWPVKRLLGWRGYQDQPDVRKITARDMMRRISKCGLRDVKGDGIEPWKGLFWGVPFFSKGGRGHQVSYLAHRVLTRCLPLPASVRQRLAVQFIVGGCKR